MRYIKHNTSLFVKNRQKFINKVVPNSISLFYSSDLYSIIYQDNFILNNNCDLFYLCGLDVKNIILLIFPDAKEEGFKEIIFIRKITETIKVWEGDFFSTEQVRCITGIKNVYWINDFNIILLQLLDQVNTIYLNLDLNLFLSNCNIPNLYFNRFIKFIRDYCSVHVFKSTHKIVQKLRLIKESEELVCIKKAVSITEKGLMKILKYIKPNVWEFELEAALIYEFIKNRAESFSFPPIIASGLNTNILHYNLNNKQCHSQELLLIDVGARYSKYCADITRVFPVNGKFSKRQKEVYQAVLNIKKHAESLLISGTLFHDYNIAIEQKVIEELFKIKLLNKYSNVLSYKRYFMHSISHHLGLDTHDVDDFFYDKFQKNMVVTIEPGIYIVDENIGIRLEDTYVVQSSGLPVNLTENFPVEYEAVEDLMIRN